MELKNCEKCGRLFAYTGSNLCTRCNIGDEENDFKKVRDYLYAHPGATIIEVSEETGVEEKLILKFLRDSRIEIREEDNVLLDCERCGVPIRSGRYCDSCTAALKREFASVLKPMKKEKEFTKPRATSKSNKMYIAEMRKKRQE